ncbi:MAG: flagellar biosynthesis protein FlhF [Candidatus Cohnella colombiensis]|uniref:Flagellar biosynthesis protein FlhF n=1 Tax=Candidatus Cohnella colombiensis TaxID=3121368 RepID=A0AA95F1X2_9BACL|nr:MAG: flagellar biosynthesis protein FlhF [Cohnella sp.]
MKVKRYIVDDLPEAVQMIRSELGSDAVILNTKEIRIGGFLGMFRKKRMEVIAAIDEGSNKPPVRKPSPAAPIRASIIEDQVQPLVKESVASSTQIPANVVRDRYSQQPFADQTYRSTPVATQLLDKEDKSSEGEQFIAAMNVMRKTPDHTQSHQPTTQADGLSGVVQSYESRDAKGQFDETSALLQELRSMKDMMTKLTKQQTMSSMSEAVMQLSKRLAEHGVEPAYVEQFAEAVHGQLELQGDDTHSAYEIARATLLSWLQPSQGTGIHPTTKIVHFVGPTGVGKTTTIAKLAAEQAFTHHRKVGFITADTYRIAAVDQLRTYADILNIPLEVVFSQSELTRAYNKLSDSDLIFMDTAGRNYRNELFVSEVNSLLAPGEQSETFLVLSMTHKYSDMKLVASQFVKYGIHQLLLTKFDETDTFGSIVNLARQYSFQISYITCGQMVPDDIRPFDIEDLIQKLLGDPNDD